MAFVWTLQMIFRKIKDFIFFPCLNFFAETMDSSAFGVTIIVCRKIVMNNECLLNHCSFYHDCFDVLSV